MCLVIVHYQESDDNHVIGVCPITHSPPRKDQGVKLPAETCVRLGLDDEAECWVITTEINQFVWPGPDLRRTPAGERVYGMLPRSIYFRIKDQLLANVTAEKVVFRPE